MRHEAAENIIGTRIGRKGHRLRTRRKLRIQRSQYRDMLVLLADDRFKYLAYSGSLHYPAMLAVSGYGFFTDNREGGSNCGYVFFHRNTIAPATSHVKRARVEYIFPTV
jgi:hypothetical protein